MGRVGSEVGRSRRRTAGGSRRQKRWKSKTKRREVRWACGRSGGGISSGGSRIGGDGWQEDAGGGEGKAREGGEWRGAGEEGCAAEEELLHGVLAVEQALVHVDVDDLRAGLGLRARDLERLVVVAVEDELLVLGRAGDVAALAD